MNAIPDLIRQDQVTQWDDAADVIGVGYGIAGACAALEVRRAGADVLVVERAGGLSLAPGSFFGRIAGRQAAAAALG